VIVTRHQPHTCQPARLQIAEDGAIGCFTLGIRHIDREDRPFAVVAHPADDQDALSNHPTALADMRVACIDDEIRIRVICERPTAPRRAGGIKHARQARHLALREGRPAQCFRNRPHFPGRDPFEVHLHHGQHQRFLRPLIARE
jgi:hypothetical protein